jgi:hypothetical protein
MAGIADIALGSAPIMGGALLGAAAGQFKGPDYRATITADLDLLDRIPPEQEARRAALRASIDERIDDLVKASQRSRRLKEIASSYQGNWRDIVLFISTVLFTIIWWNVEHSRTNWLPMFLVLIAVSLLTAYYALRGAFSAIRGIFRRKPS